MKFISNFSLTVLDTVVIFLINRFQNAPPQCSLSRILDKVNWSFRKFSSLCHLCKMASSGLRENVPLGVMKPSSIDDKSLSSQVSFYLFWEVSRTFILHFMSQNKWENHINLLRKVICTTTLFILYIFR